MNNGWNPPPRELVLSPEFIDVWRMPLNLRTAETDSMFATLSQEEQIRAGKIKSSTRKKQFVIGRGSMRMLIGRYLDIDPASFEFAYSAHQKPLIPETSLGIPVTFNITHSHEMVLLALSLERCIGVDIERIRDDVEFKKLADRFFSRQETEVLENYDKSELPAAFFACWTRKEAFVKALGDGISFGLSEFSVSVDPCASHVDLRINTELQGSDTWSIMNVEVGGEYAAAVAASQGDFRVRLWAGDL